MDEAQQMATFTAGWITTDYQINNRVFANSLSRGFRPMIMESITEPTTDPVPVDKLERETRGNRTEWQMFAVPELQSGTGRPFLQTWAGVGTKHDLGGTSPEPVLTLAFPEYNPISHQLRL